MDPEIGVVQGDCSECVDRRVYEAGLNADTLRDEAMMQKAPASVSTPAGSASSYSAAMTSPTTLSQTSGSSSMASGAGGRVVRFADPDPGYGAAPSSSSYYSPPANTPQYGGAYTNYSDPSYSYQAVPSTQNSGGDTDLTYDYGQGSSSQQGQFAGSYTDPNYDYADPSYDYADPNYDYGGAESSHQGSSSKHGHHHKRRKHHR